MNRFCWVTGWIASVIVPAVLFAEELPRTDVFGDPLPENALARLGTTRYRFPFGVEGLAFSPDGRELVGLCDAQIHLWQATTGKHLRSWSAGRGWSSRSLHFSKDGRSLIRAEEKQVRIWDAATGKDQRSFPIPNSPSYSELSSDGRWLATTDVGEPYRVWDVASGKEVGQIPWEADFYLGIAWIPGTKILALLALDYERGPSLRLWDVSADNVRRFPLPKTSNFQEKPRMAFSADGKTLAVTQKCDIQLYEWMSAKKSGLLKGHRGFVNSLDFSPSGELLVSTGEDKTMRFWALTKDGKSASSIRVKLSRVRESRLAFSPDGKLLAGPGEAQEIRMWDTATGKEAFLPVGPIHQSQPIGFFPDNRTLLTFNDKDGYRLWDSAAAKEVGHILTREKCGWSTLSGNARYLAVGRSDQSFAVWDLQTSKKVLNLPNPQTGNLVVVSGAHHVVFSPDDRFLAAGSLLSLSLYEVGTWKLLHEFDANSLGFWGLTFSRDSQVLAISGRDNIQGWSTATGKKVWEWPIRFPEYAYSIAFSPDGRSLASAGGDQVLVREVSTGKIRAHFPWPEEQGRLERVAFSKDGRMLVGMSKDSISAWDPLTGAKGFHRQESWGFSHGMTWTADGAKMATSGYDSTLLIWDTKAMRPRVAASAELSAQELKELWTSLADAPDTAYAAMGKLARSPKQSLAWLRNRFPPAQAVDKQRLARLLVDLDSDQFQVREKASSALRDLEDAAQPLVVEALEKSASLEQMRRLQRLLEPWGPSGVESIRFLRAVELVEYLGSADARQWLVDLATGAPGVFRTETSSAALKRWDDSKR